MNPAPGMTPLSPEELTRLGALMAARGGEQTMTAAPADCEARWLPSERDTPDQYAVR
jgi:hypothetical protein